MAATMLMTSPTKVSTLGEMRVSAKPLTMACKMTPQPRPKALVQVKSAGLLEAQVQRFRGWFGLSGESPKLVLLLLRPAFGGFIVNGGELQDFQFALAVRGHGGGHVADLLADQRAADG